MIALALACAVSPGGPPSIAWDVDTCAQCGMLIGDPRTAAALRTPDARTLAFDDAACLVRWMDAHPDTGADVWFGGPQGVWLPGADVAFEERHDTPMGGGLWAVPAGTPGAIGFGEARRRLLSGDAP